MEEPCARIPIQRESLACSFLENDIPPHLGVCFIVLLFIGLSTESVSDKESLQGEPHCKRPRGGAAAVLVTDMKPPNLNLKRVDDPRKKLLFEESPACPASLSLDGRPTLFPLLLTKCNEPLHSMLFHT